MNQTLIGRCIRQVIVQIIALTLWCCIRQHGGLALGVVHGTGSEYNGVGGHGGVGGGVVGHGGVVGGVVGHAGVVGHGGVDGGITGI